MGGDARRFQDGLSYVPHLHVGALFLRVDEEQSEGENDKLCSKQAFDAIGNRVATTQYSVTLVPRCTSYIFDGARVPAARCSS